MDWTKRTLAQTLRIAAEDSAEVEALVVGDERITYRALWDRMRLAAANLKRLGVRRGEHVALCLPNSVDWLIFWYAASTLGAVTVPVNTRFKTDEIRYCLEQSDAVLLVTAGRFLKIDFIAMLRATEPAIDSQLPGNALPLLRTLLMVGEHERPAGALSSAELSRPVADLPSDASEDVDPDNVFLIQYTSGSTSFPKGVMLSHDNMLRDAAEAGARLGLRRGDRYFYVRPFYHVAGTTLALLAALQARATVVSVPTFEPGESLAVMERERCTVIGGNDTIFLMLMNHPDFASRRFSLRTGWSAASPTVMRQVIARFGMEGLSHAYGLSEASPNIWMTGQDEALEVRISGYGRPLPGLEVRLVDPDTGDVKSDSGEIQVRGWSVMKGYYKMPEQTALALDADGWLHTGDLGTGDGEGRFAFAARLKEVFRVGGENVAPAEVEDVLHRNPKVRQSQVVGVPNERLGEVGAAFVVLNDGVEATEEELIEWCRERCANFRVPRYVRMVESFEPIGMTGSGKVQKVKLRAYALNELGLGE